MWCKLTLLFIFIGYNVAQSNRKSIGKKIKISKIITISTPFTYCSIIQPMIQVLVYSKILSHPWVTVFNSCSLYPAQVSSTLYSFDNNNVF